MDNFHAFFLCPFFCACKKCVGNFLIIYAVKTRKSYTFFANFFIVKFLDNCSNSANNSAIFKSQEAGCFAVIIRHIFFRVKIVYFIHTQWVHIVWAVFIKGSWKIYKLFFLFFCFNFLNFYHSYIVLLKFAKINQFEKPL